MVEYLIRFFLSGAILITACHTPSPPVLTGGEKGGEQAVPKRNENGLIMDCPEELIENAMPVIGNGDGTISKVYYIYRGARRELSEFDTAWIRKNCQVKRTVAY